MKHVLKLLIATLVVSGCAQFPAGPAKITDGEVRSWHVKRRDQYDYFQYLDRKGKIVGLGYDDNGDGRPEIRIDLLTVCPPGGCPHYVILLDGIPYQLVKELYDQGRFRLFYRPSKLISCFPSMTDLACCRMLGPEPPDGFEALWYDRTKGRLTGGKLNYISEKNAPWQKLIDYRAAMILDAVGYVKPGFLFSSELAGMERTFNRNDRGVSIGYSVGTATVGTRKGRDGIIKCLKKVDQLCEKLVYERRGRCRITMLADHGHNLTASKYFDVSKVLKEEGFKPVKKLKDPNDVVCIEFGLVTYSGIYTDQPDKVADALLKHDPVEFAIYRCAVGSNNNRRIIVRDKVGSARIAKTEKGYIYEIEAGDPLKLKPIIDTLKTAGKVTAAGEIDDRSLFEATVDHEYPDPLARIYLAFNGLAKHPPDLIVTIKDGWFCGARDLAGSITVASTHGSLNQANSVTFLMSTVKELPEAVRLEDVKTLFPEIIPSQKRR